MKHIIGIAILAASLSLVGCSTTTPLITPAELQSDVSGGIKIGLDVYPAAAPDVALARDVICVAASSPNTSPADIVNDLMALNIASSDSKLIVDGALFVYEKVYTALGTNATAQAAPYLTALCNGFTAGLPDSVATVKGARQSLPPHLK